MNAANATAGTSRRWFLPIVAGLAGAILGFWLLADALDRVDRGVAASGWIDEAIDVRRQRIANRDAYAQDVAAVRKDLAALQERLPGQFADADVDAGLRALAERHGLVVEKIERGSERMRDFYASRELRFELRGNAPALQAFFRDYADIVPIQRVGQLHLVPSAGDAHLFTAAVQAEEYRYIEDDTRRY